MGTIFLIMVGAFTFGGGISLVKLYTDGMFAYLPMWISERKNITWIAYFTYAVIPLAMFNGYMMNEWRGLLIVGIGTLIGGFIEQLIPFSPIIKFMLGGMIFIIWTFVNIIIFF